MSHRHGREKLLLLPYKWIFGCSARMRHFFTFDAVEQLWGKKRRADEFDADSCVKETCGSVHGCITIVIAEAGLVRRFGTYSNIRRIRRKRKLFPVAYG